MNVVVIGAGLAGCEAAYQLTRFNIEVLLIDMKPKNMSPAHKSVNFAELVCSNSLKADRIESASGLLKEEMRIIGSLTMEAAEYAKLPAGGALAVDRDKFSQYITEKIKNNPLIKFESNTVNKIPINKKVIIATGPLTTGELYDDIKEVLGSEELEFYDAASPIIQTDSINMNIAFKQSRYNRGSDDYINCPMDKQTYEKFWDALVSAQVADIKDFEDKKVFEGCMPIETMAKRGKDTIRFGPLKPVGLTDPKTDKTPYACVQLRQDNKENTLYNMVGFQTRLKFNEQKRIFSMIPGLESAQFARFGVMHRNTFIKSPGILNEKYQSIKNPNLFFAGQITGVEGYVESINSGMVSGINMALSIVNENESFILPTSTMTGSLANYIANSTTKKFQPMNANFGIIDSLNEKIRSKEERYRKIANNSLEVVKNSIKYYNNI